MNNYFKANFAPYQISRECFSEEEAKDCVTLIQDVADHLATKFPVYIRVAPHYTVERRFEEEHNVYVVKVRMTVGPAEAGAGYR